MPRPVRLLFFLLFSLLAVCSTPTVYGEDLRALYEQMHTGNRMDAIGQAPFYLKIAAQLYDLEGKPSETATIEQWWDAGRYRMELTKRGGKEVQTSAPDSLRLSATRTGYLMRSLLDEVVNPMNSITPEVSFVSVNRTFGSLKVRCVAANWSRSTQAPPQSFYCTPPGSTDVILELQDPLSAATRTPIARFHEVSVPLKVSCMYLGKYAVTGEVVALRSFDVKMSSFPEFAPGASGSDERDIQRGYLAHGGGLDLPMAGRTTVGVTFAISAISATGAVTSTEIIASTSTAISASALRSLPDWKYKPSTRFGKPIDYYTTVLLNPSNH